MSNHKIASIVVLTAAAAFGMASACESRSAAEAGASKDAISTAIASQQREDAARYGTAATYLALGGLAYGAAHLTNRRRWNAAQP